MTTRRNILRAEDTAPARTALNVSKSDSTTHTNVRGVYVGTGGTVVLVDQNDNTSTWVNVPNGTLIPIAAKKIMSTDTTASNFVIVK